MSEVVTSLLGEQTGELLQPPVLLLGQFERVGSTFYIDQLEKENIVHNEPYKLLLPSEWPIAKGYDGQLTSVDEFFESGDVSELDKHWMRNFVASLHYPGHQYVKETNLYLALPQFLDIFPYSNVELLTRHPIGIVSSFQRSDLYHRWGYADVARVVGNQLEAGQPDNYEALQSMLAQGDSWPTKLAWMIGLNAVLLSRHVSPDRLSKIISYEDDVIPLSSPETVVHARVEDSIFGTNIYKTHDDFESRFTADEMIALRGAMRACADFVQTEFDGSDQRLFYDLYGRHVDKEVTGAKPSAETKLLGAVSVATETRPQTRIEATGEHESAERRLVKFDPGSNVLWDYALITNKQMGAFLQGLTEHGLDPSLNNYLMMDHMPPARGGRITFDKSEGAFKATEGFDDYPAYWISWLAASLYAYKEGMRLPLQAEWQHVYDNFYVPEEHDANHTYANDDATPTGTGEGPLPDDFFGNLKTWCSDWSNEALVSKRLAGISWKHYYHDAFKTSTERPYLTNSRVIGARLVCCGECGPAEPKSMTEAAAKFDEVVDLIHTNPVTTMADLSQLNEKISRLLTPAPCGH
ncbi:MAG: hypothetical protein JWM37_61 [Candidatus Saccharibacteria bacterium]|nr:hypothetical protein [Candidatus Saccharibacteria bacterium]